MMCGVECKQVPSCLCYELYQLALRTRETRRQKQGAFGGLDPTRPAYIAPYWKILFIRPEGTSLHHAWLGVTSNQIALFDALALDLWEAPESVVVVAPRTAASRESCPLTFHYWFTDVERAMLNMQRQVAGGASPTQYRVEPVRGQTADFALAIFTGQGRVPPIIDGFSSKYFFSGDGRAIAW